MKSELQIEVAHHVIGLNFKGKDAAAFIKEVTSAYELFLSDKKPDLFIELELSSDTPPEDFPLAKLTFKDNIITIEDDYLCGNLDLSARCGKLKLNPLSPLFPLGTFLRNVYTLLVFLQDKGIVLHAVGVLEGDEAYIFIGPSTAGKTTVANLSSPRIILSDDLLMLKRVDREFKVFPTPYWGDKQIGPRQNRPYRINSLFKLIKDKEVYLERFSPGLALANIFTVPHIPAEFIPQDELLASFQELLSKVPYYGLHFLPEPSFWDCIERVKSEAMFHKVS